MFLHGTLSPYARVINTTAYGTGMVVGTAVLIAVTQPGQDWHGKDESPTHAEVVMQAAMQKALASPAIAQVAATGLSERRGL